MKPEPKYGAIKRNRLFVTWDYLSTSTSFNRNQIRGPGPGEEDEYEYSDWSAPEIIGRLRERGTSTM